MNLISMKSMFDSQIGLVVYILLIRRRKICYVLLTLLLVVQCMEKRRSLLINRYSLITGVMIREVLEKRSSIDSGIPSVPSWELLFWYMHLGLNDPCREELVISGWVLEAKYCIWELLLELLYRMYLILLDL